MKETLQQAPQLLVFSANSQDGLRRLVSNYQEYIKLHPERLPDLAYTLSQRREHLPHRAFSVTGNGSDAEVSSFAKAPGSMPQISLIFSGQGAQWPEMGRDLIKSDPRFREDIMAMDDILQSLKYPPEWTIESK